MKPILRPLATLLAFSASAHAGAGYDVSPVFAFDTRDFTAMNGAESAVFAFSTWDDTSKLSVTSATFAFDTRAIDGLVTSATSGTFFFNTKSLIYSGLVRTMGGVAIPGASVRLQRSGVIFWQGVSDGSGAFFPTIAPSNYTAVVAKEGYRTFIDNLSGSAGGNGSLNFYLAELPGTMAPVDVVRVPPLAAIGPTTSGSELKAFANGSFATNVTLHPDRMTIVLCHGWTGSPSDWALEMAALITARTTLAEMPNIVVWDWHEAAAGNLLSIVGKIDTASKEGLFLGQSLQQALGTGYSGRLHFVGHSLGTIVNRYACDYVHASSSRTSMNAPLPWLASETRPHVTLLDEAELASVVGTQAIISTLVTSARMGVAGGALAQAANWKTPIPKDAAWVDNFISAVGIQHDSAVNVCLLQAAETNPNPVAAHAYAHEWYRQSIAPPLNVADAPVGFARAFERALSFPPTGTGLSLGSLWLENTATATELDLTLDPTPTFGEASRRLAAAYAIQTGRTVKEGAEVLVGQVVQTGEAVAIGLIQGTDTYVVKPLDAIGRAVIEGSIATVEAAVSIGTTVVNKTGQVITETREKVGNFVDATTDHFSNAIDSLEADIRQSYSTAIPFLRIRMLTVPAILASGGNNGLAATPAGQPAYAWMTIHVPETAAFIAFDFTVTGQPAEDRIVCAINEQNVFNLPAKFAPDGIPSSTDMIDVSSFAGQNIELLFGIAGGTSTNCEVAIDGIRFTMIPKPKLALVQAGANVQVKWPAAASGWALESTTSLAAPNWQPVSTATSLTVESGVTTLEQPTSGAQKFYRLRRSP